MATDRSQVSVLLIRPPSPSGLGQETHEMKLIVLTIDLIRGTIGDKGIKVIGHGEIGAGLRPNVVGFRRMDMGIIPAGRGQDVVVIRGISHLSADVDLAPIDRGNGGSVNQAVNERGVGVLENLLDAGNWLAG